MTSHQQHERGRARPAQAVRTPHAHVAQPTCASASCLACYYIFKTEKTSIVGYFIAIYAKMPFLTVTLQVVYNEINHLSY